MASTLGSTTSVDSMSKPLIRVGMRRPRSILTADPDIWHYDGPMRPTELAAQYDEFVRLVEASGAEIVWIEDTDDGLADSIFTYDPSIIVPGGAVVLRPGKDLREDEAALHRRFFDTNSIPVLGEIEAPGTIEGGDMFWMDSTTIAVGRGFRTNQSGIDQLAGILEPLALSLEAYDLPYYDGPEACLHLMSVVSPLAEDLALVYAPMVPTALYQRLAALGYELLHAPKDEFIASKGLSLNVLATSPRSVIAVAGNPRTAEMMVDAGCTVDVFNADALCLPCEGGPTCLTRPLLRV